jgi:hypothetical protein
LRWRKDERVMVVVGEWGRIRVVWVEGQIGGGNGGGAILRIPSSPNNYAFYFVLFYLCNFILHFSLDGFIYLYF